MQLTVYNFLYNIYGKFSRFLLRLKTSSRNDFVLYQFLQVVRVTTSSIKVTNYSFLTGKRKEYSTGYTSCHHSFIHLFLKAVTCLAHTVFWKMSAIKNHKMDRYSNLERKYTRYSDLKRFPSLARKAKN